jgi:hypothetical protein
LEPVLQVDVTSSIEDDVTALAAIQAHILKVRQMAAEAADPVKRAGSLRIAEPIGKRAREEDQKLIAAAGLGAH